MSVLPVVLWGPRDTPTLSPCHLPGLEHRDPEPGEGGISLEQPSDGSCMIHLSLKKVIINI